VEEIFGSQYSDDPTKARNLSEKKVNDGQLPPPEEDKSWGPFLPASDAEIAKFVKRHFPFAKFREYQEAIINKIIQAFRDFKYVVVEAPTGSGKSLIADTLAQVLNNHGPKSVENKSFFTVPYKTLQDQYVKDFKDIALMKGVSNYRCYQDPRAHCGAAPCRVPTFDGALTKQHGGICTYQKAREIAKNSDITLFNTAAFLTYKNYTPTFNARKLIVVDEAHTLESALMQFVGINFHSESLRELGIVEEMPKFDTPEEYIPWVDSLHTYAAGMAQAISDTVSTEAEVIGCSKYSIMTKEQKKLLSLSKEYADRSARFLAIIATNDSDEEAEQKRRANDFFVVSLYEFADKQTLEFKPIVVDQFAHEYFFKHGGFFLFLSATIYIDDFCKSMGLNRDEVKFFKVPSTFPNPKKRRPFIVDGNIGALNNRILQDKLPLIVARIEEITANYPQLKGVIHTHTYKINDYILRNASESLRDRLVSHKGGTVNMGLNREEALSDHINRVDASILISPMMYEGVDLKGDLARWQIIVKAPYSSLVDPQVKRRMEIDPEWYQWQTILKIIQAYGRATRSKDDWSYTFMLDRNFLGLYSRNRSMFSKWFTEALIVKKEVH